jgi:hypothetical protein
LPRLGGVEMRPGRVPDEPAATKGVEQTPHSTHMQKRVLVYNNHSFRNLHYW